MDRHRLLAAVKRRWPQEHGHEFVKQQVCRAITWPDHRLSSTAYICRQSSVLQGSSSAQRLFYCLLQRYLCSDLDAILLFTQVASMLCEEDAEGVQYCCPGGLPAVGVKLQNCLGK
jgi:hypothetical protein